MRVLSAVEQRGTTHGYQVARHLANCALGDIKGGTLYPVLTRLEEQGLTTTRWVEGAGGPGRKLVEISPAGRDACAERQQQWITWTDRVQGLLRYTATPQTATPQTISAQTISAHSQEVS